MLESFSKRLIHRSGIRRLPVHLLFLALPLVGCGGNIGAPVTLVIPNVSGNWQIQTTNAAPSNGLILLGTLNVQGNNATGTFRFGDLAQNTECGSTLQTLNFSGTINPKTGQLDLNSDSFGIGGSTIQAFLGLSPTPHDPEDGNIVISGTNCTYPASPAVGIQIAPIDGTYQGTIALPGSLPDAGQATVSLNLTQAATPNPDGQYAVTGSVTFAGTGCTETVNASGTVSGENLNLVSTPSASGVSDITISAAPNPTATQLGDASFNLMSGPCYSSVTTYNTYTGTLMQ